MDTLSIQSGDFSKVIVDAVPEYLGFALESGNSIVRDTKEYRQKFRRSLASKNVPGTVAFGPNGLYISRITENFDLAFLEYTYEIYPGTTSDVEFDRQRFDQAILYGGYLFKGGRAATYQIYYMYLPLTPGNTMFFKAGDDVSFWGVHPVFGRCTVSFSIARLGRVDPVNGRPLADLTLIRHRENSNGSLMEYPLETETFTRPNAEFMWITQQVVLKDFTVGIFAETFFRPGPIVGGTDYVPKFWAVTTPNTENFGDMTYTDLTSGVFSGARQPTPLTSPVMHYGVVSGRNYQFDLSATMSSMQLAVVANNAFVMAWQIRMPDGWRTRVARAEVSGGNVTATISHETGDQSTRSTLEFWQSIVHLGNGIVLAKIVDGFPGINHEVLFRVSMDGGMTWGSAFSPSGFGATLVNQNFGNFRVHKPEKDGNPGRVLIPAWDESESAYYVWSSDDRGASWERRAKIYKPDSFLRVDSMVAGDGGGNFTNLVPGPVLSNELDPTLPDRYKDRS